MTQSRPAILLLCCLCGAAGCHDAPLDLPPLAYTTPRTRIGVGREADAPLCRADLDHLDAQVAFIETHLGVHRKTPIDIYLLDFDDLPCSPDAFGCYRPDDDAIYGAWETIDHELVHAVSREIEYPSLFWSEGAAEVLSGTLSRKDLRVTLTPAAFDVDALTTYLTPAHFSRFLVETRGWERYARIVRGEGFERAYGSTATELTAAYERDAPYAYPALLPCAYPEMAQVDDGVWHESIAIESCDEPGVTQFEYVTASGTNSPAVIRRIDLEAGTYAFDLDGTGSSLVLLGCTTTPLAERPPSIPSSGDLFNEIDFGQGTLFPSIGAQLLELTAGAYRISVVAPTDAPFTGELTVTRMD